MDLGTLTTTLGTNMGPLKRGLDAAENRMQRYKRMSVSSLNRVRTAAFSLRGAFIALGAGLAIRKALQDYSTLNEGLISVQKTTNFTTKELDAFESKILNLARNIGVSTQSLLSISEAAGQLGVQGVDNVALFTKTLGEMQLASDLAGDEGAKALARLLNVTGEGVDDIHRLGSVIVELGNNIEASESEITRMASEIGMGATQFGIASREAAAYGAAIKAMGGRAELAGTTIGRTMREIQGAMIEGGESMEYLQKITGMTGDVLEKTFEKDAAQVFNAWLEGVNRAVEGGEKLNVVLGRFGMTGERQIKVLAPLIKNIDILRKTWKMANDEWEANTALTEEAIRANESFSAQMQMTWNTVDQVMAKIGQGLAPVIVDIANDFRNWIDANQEFINQDLPDYMSSVAGGFKTMFDVVIGSGKTATIIFANFAINANKGIEVLLDSMAKLIAVQRIILELGSKLSSAALLTDIDDTILDRLESAEKILNNQADAASENADIWLDILATLEGYNKGLGNAANNTGELNNKTKTLAEITRPVEERFKQITDSMKEAADASDEVNDKYKKMVDQLEFEIEILGEDEVTQNAMTLMRRADIEASSEQGNNIKRLVSKLHNEKQMLDEATAATKRHKETLAEFNTIYSELGQGTYEKQLQSIEDRAKAYKAAAEEQIDDVRELAQKRVEIEKWVAEETKKVNREILNYQLGQYASLAGGIANTFRQISQAGGESTKEAFRMYQAFAIAQAAIAGVMAYMAVLSDMSIPNTYVRIAMAAATAAIAGAKIAMIASAQPPSYDEGGVSRARGVYQTGNIAEAHIPLKGGRVPVELSGADNAEKEQNVRIINLLDQSLFEDWASSATGEKVIMNVVRRNQ